MAIKKEFVIKNQYGIHARPAALFVKTCSQFECDVTVEKDGNSVSGKSIMGMMTLEASCGSSIFVTAEGLDENKAIDALEKLIESKFEEE